jgi:hypothetical protein
MKKLTCTTPNGAVTRTTHRKYSHVVVVFFDDGTDHKVKAVRWAGSERLAKADVNYWMRMYPGRTVAVYPVDQEAAQ